MLSSPPRRGRHRKRISALRLSSDTTVSTLPAYTSPPATWSKSVDFLAEGDISDRPPDYPDSAEEADADTDSDESHNLVYYSPPPPPLPLSPSRRPRRSQPSRTHRRQSSAAQDSPYLDSLLARSVHALEMSNALLQSSMSTQSSLSAVLASDSMADRSLEARAQMLSSRIAGNRDRQETWLDDLADISRSVENLVGDEQEQESASDLSPLPEEDVISKSLPTSGLAERMERRGQLRRPSLDLRNASSSQLQYSNHDRSHFVAPAPRALTMYIDSSDDPDLITLPPTLGLRTTSHLPPTPLPSQTFSDPGTEPTSEPADQTRRIVDVLSSFVNRSPSRLPTSVSSSPRMPSTMSGRSGRSSSTSSSSHTIRRVRQSKSPPAKATSSSPGSAFRSRSLTPMRTTSPAHHPRQMTPPIEELSGSSDSSSSDTMHVDRTLESLRNILDRQPPPVLSSSANGKSLPPRPAFLSPPTVAPISGTSNATASISRLFTKARHSSSTRPPSPPRQSVLKNRSAPPTPSISETPTPNLTAPPTPTLLGFPVPIGDLVTRTRSIRSASSTSASGRSTPKRISFAELPESYASSKPEGVQSKFRQKKAREGRSGKGKGKEKEDDGGAWWTGWLLGAAGTGSGSGLSLGAAREERIAQTPSWTSRPGYGGSWEEWGA